MSPPVVIYRHDLLQASETFVRAQAETLESFQPYYVGVRYAAGLELPRQRMMVANQGGLRGKLNAVAFKLWGWAQTINSQLEQLQPVLIHAHFGQDGALALPLSRKLGIPLVVTYHGYDITVKDEYAERSLTQWLYFRRIKALQREATLFIAVSEFIKQQLIKRGFPEQKIVVHYIGIDTNLFQTDAAVTRQPIVLFVARLVEKKGCAYLIQAMRQVQAELPEVELVVIGDGPLRSQLEQLAASSLKRYRFLGVQPPAVVQQWMRSAQVFSVPSITASTGDAEGFGLVFAEAQAMGLPVVSFASGGVPEAVAHERTGFLATERDSQALAAYILHLLQDQALWQQFSNAGKQRVHAHFNLHTQTRALERIYRERVLNAV